MRSMHHARQAARQAASSLLRPHRTLPQQTRRTQRAAPRSLVQTHTLRDLRLNDRPALPAALLDQLARAEASAPDLLQFFSTAFLTLSDSLLSPVGAPPRAAPSADALRLDPAFALGFTALVRSLHRQLPNLAHRAARHDHLRSGGRAPWASAGAARIGSTARRSILCRRSPPVRSAAR